MMFSRIIPFAFLLASAAGTSAQHNESFPHPIPTIWLSVKEVVEKFESLGYAVLYKGLSERYADNVFSEDIREKYRPIGNIDLIFEKVDAN